MLRVTQEHKGSKAEEASPQTSARIGLAHIGFGQNLAPISWPGRAKPETETTNSGSIL